MTIVNTSGKRKRSIARATLRPGNGEIRINNILLENYNPEMAKMKIMEPLILSGDITKKISISVRVFGGGVNSQAEAVRLAIARALSEHNSSLKEKFLEYDRTLLIADTRRKETRKPNDSKARAKRQKSYR